ncbi:MAG TPA: DUF5011 domain-containing protein [Candidatus Paceibacterota bacterium]|nr:DUF5011 domain-containing protein [Candidatus Paceibacterota bacterium]
MLKNFLIIFGLIFLLIPIFRIEAISVPIVTYFLNEVSSDVTSNPLTDPIKLGFLASGNIEDWVSLKIENIADPSIYKSYRPGSDCDDMDRCEEFWDGKISASDKVLADGIYKVVIHIKNISDPTFDLTLTSPYTITVDTSVPFSDTTAPLITLLGEALVDLTVGDTYSDAGVTVMDDIDGDLTASTTAITVTGLPVDTSASGTQFVVYTATDSSSNSASTTRTINISDSAPVTAPTIDPVPSVTSQSSGSTGYVQDISLLLANPSAGQVLGASTSRISEETRQRRLTHLRRRLLGIKRELLLLERPELKEIILAEDPLVTLTTASETSSTATANTSTDPVKKPFWKFW